MKRATSTLRWFQKQGYSWSCRSSSRIIMALHILENPYFYHCFRRLYDEFSTIIHTLHSVVESGCTLVRNSTSMIHPRE